jgi:hypothetical protein
VGALGAAARIALVWAPPLDFKGLCGAVLVHLERLENFDIGRRGPRLLAYFNLLGLAVAGLVVHLADLKLARLPDREAKIVPERRGFVLLFDFNVEVFENYGLKFRKIATPFKIELLCRRRRGAAHRFFTKSCSAAARRRQLHLFPRGCVSRQISASMRQKH